MPESNQITAINLTASCMAEVGGFIRISRTYGSIKWLGRRVVNLGESIEQVALKVIGFGEHIEGQSIYWTHHKITKVTDRAGIEIDS